MIAKLSDHVFATSNDNGSIAIWSSISSDRWTDLRTTGLLHYDPALGPANCGLKFGVATPYFAVGHANGFLTIWSGDHTCLVWQLLKIVDLRATVPVNPWGLHNIRGIDLIAWKFGKGILVTGSEDGDLVTVGVPTGKILSRFCYNSAAKRGINALAVNGIHLIVANCSVGSRDMNFWSYLIERESGRIVLADSINLAIDKAAVQTFNFDVGWGAFADGKNFFLASTEEGVLWLGTIESNGRISVIGSVPVTRSTKPGEFLHLGSGVCCQNEYIAVANYDVSEFKVTI